MDPVNPGTRLNRRQVVARLLEDREDLAVVTGLGSSTYDVASCGDHDNNFYLWGAMGGAAMLGYGIATAQPARPVTVFTGDGEMVMGLGSLATIGLRCGRAQILPWSLSIMASLEKQASKPATPGMVCH
jgi:thiamine pyrophosphate-dependent acetolactate synthase large subunit-like protein